jgi:hypothetical protein
VELYAQQLGPRNSLVVDLEHRINQVCGGVCVDGRQRNL